MFSFLRLGRARAQGAVEISGNTKVAVSGAGCSRWTWLRSPEFSGQLALHGSGTLSGEPLAWMRDIN